MFKVRLLVSDKLAIDCSSDSIVLDLEVGTTGKVSSAYMNNLFIRHIMRWFDALMTYETGPNQSPERFNCPESWTIEAFMTRKPEIMSMTLVQWRRLEKYSGRQL